MKHIIFIAAILLFTQGLYAQKNTDFYKHEVGISLGDACIPSIGILLEGGNMYFANLTVSYFYRPAKWFWVGGNFVNLLGERLDYDWRVYDFDGNVTEFSKSKMKYCAILAPALRVSYLNTKTIIIYSALSGGVGLEYGYDYRNLKFPVTICPYFHFTSFGISGNLGKDNKIFAGGELGIGYGSLISVHCGYRF